LKEEARKRGEISGEREIESIHLAFVMLMESAFTVGFSILSPLFCWLTVANLGASKFQINTLHEKRDGEMGEKVKVSILLEFWMLMESLLKVGFSILSPLFCWLTVANLGASK
jgi:hypothetical protein